MTNELTGLNEPFDPNMVKWRIGSTTSDKKRGMALAYIDARAVMDRLDEVCGPEGWADEFVDSPSGRVFCKLSIKVGDEWVTKSDAAGDTDVEGLKGGMSDAFKRAAVKWGIGRYLYSLDSPWVDIQPAGRSFRITDAAQAQLTRLLSGKANNKAVPRSDARAETSPQAQAERAPKWSEVSPPITDKKRKELHAIGTEAYGPDWDEKRHELIAHFNIESSNDLTMAQAQKLIDGMRAKLDA